MKLLCGSMQDQQLVYIGAAANRFFCHFAENVRIEIYARLYLPFG